MPWPGLHFEADPALRRNSPPTAQAVPLREACKLPDGVRQHGPHPSPPLDNARHGAEICGVPCTIARLPTERAHSRDARRGQCLTLNLPDVAHGRSQPATASNLPAGTTLGASSSHFGILTRGGIEGLTS